MISRILFSQGALRANKSALDAYAERSRVHAENVANVETPGYRARRVRFEEDLRQALQTSTSSGLRSTHGNHLSMQAKTTAGRVEFQEPQSTWNTNGINDVDIDREMAAIAANTMRFTVAAELVRRSYTGMRKAIHGRTMSA